AANRGGPTSAAARRSFWPGITATPMLAAGSIFSLVRNTVAACSPKSRPVSSTVPASSSASVIRSKTGKAAELAEEAETAETDSTQRRIQRRDRIYERAPRVKTHVE